ncbi:MAG: desulfoferrodoxin [Deltaproteobacteria bacterium]|jgi:superoxide reductase|nr:desulfoferrodoxin [Deltaproteobacteria bacterium]
MTKKMEVYKCEKCGNIVEMTHGGIGQLVCCDQKMTKMEEQTADYKTEKHVPIFGDSEKGVKVVVGSTAHPMTEEHYIEWIEVINGNYVNRKYLKPGDKPEAQFYVPKQNSLILRDYCNVHGLWKNEQ